MLVTMREVQVAQEQVGDYRKYAEQQRMLQGEMPTKPSLWQILRSQIAGKGQGLRAQGRMATPAASISGSLQ